MKLLSFLSALALAASTSATPTKAHGGKEYLPIQGLPFHFTSTYSVIATPDQVVNGTTPTGGLPGAVGYYNLGFNSVENVVCYNITLFGFQGNYSSPAATATHLHQAARGTSGTPRLALPNPVLDHPGEPLGRRRSLGCLVGPFTTGLLANGTDTGVGFHVSQIEKDPAAFMVDVHSSLAVPGAVRGQLC